MGARFAHAMAEYLKPGKQKPLVSKLQTAIKKEYLESANHVLENEATMVEMDIASAGYQRTGEMISNARIFGHEIIKENPTHVTIEFGFNVGSTANQNWEAGGWKWNLFEFQSPNNPNVKILPNPKDVADIIKLAYKKNLKNKG